MNPEIKERWLTALRSGKYKQTDGYLNIQRNNPEAVPEGNLRGNGYCCLGVLCELAVADGVIKKRHSPEGDFFEYGNPEANDWDYSVLPLSVKDWAGLTDTNPYINDTFIDEDSDSDYPDNWIPISEPNDNGSNFEEIAQMIERDL